MTANINTTNIYNIGTGYSRYCSYTPFFGGGFSPGCFGWGFCNPFLPMMCGSAIGFGLGWGIGANFPDICKGVGKAIGGLGTAIGGAACWAGRGIGWLANGAWKGITAAGKAIGSAASWFGNGVAKLATGAWNGIKNFFGWVGRGFKSK